MKMITREDIPAIWHKLPAELKRRWWGETDYGRLEPSSELLDAIAAAAGLAT